MIVAVNAASDYVGVDAIVVEVAHFGVTNACLHPSMTKLVAKAAVVGTVAEKILLRH